MKKLPIIMHGITGRMGYNQHLCNSMLPIIKEGGVKLSNGDRILPEPILLGRNKNKLAQIARDKNINQFTDDYSIIESTENAVFFDAGTTLMRPELLERAMKAGQHIYCEKPIGMSLTEAENICRIAKNTGVKTGIVMDKLFLPGLLKLKRLVNEGFFGRIVSIKIDFGYWVFSGENKEQMAQRPAWNYKKSEGGSIIFDMMCHWRYVLDHIIAPVQSVDCVGVTAIKHRVDEKGQTYTADADDAFYANLILQDGIMAQISSSWCTRVNRDDLVTFQVDGTQGSAVAGLTQCKTQSLAQTPRPVWNPDQPNTINFTEQWQPYLAEATFDNGFKTQWEMFIKSLYGEGNYIYTLNEGAKGVQLAQLAMQSWKERRWLDVQALNL
ncbi:gfo/Idh/MocA family oxidoreductase [bacterium]|nr:gfo/Idh/MocA family oxidoreductase [bacterium]